MRSFRSRIARRIASLSGCGQWTRLWKRYYNDEPMKWGALARVAFVAVIAYCAMVVSPLAAGAVPNIAFGVAIAGLVIFVEDRLRHTPLANVIGALIGGTVGLLLARLIGDAHFWANAANLGVIFLHTLILLALPYIGLVLGDRKSTRLNSSH